MRREVNGAWSSTMLLRLWPGTWMDSNRSKIVILYFLAPREKSNQRWWGRDIYQRETPSGIDAPFAIISSSVSILSKIYVVCTSSCGKPL